MTVEEAYTRRQRKQPAKPSGDADGASESKRDVTRLRKSVKLIAERANEVIHDAAFAEPAEAVILIPAIRKTIQQLQEVLTCLERQAVTTAVDVPSETPELEATPGTTS